MRQRRQMPTSSGSELLAAVIVGTLSGTLEKHNDVQRAPSARLGISIPFRECPPGVLIVKSGRLSAEFDEGDGLKSRCRFHRKSWIRQVLISRTLSVCGE